MRPARLLAAEAATAAALAVAASAVAGLAAPAAVAEVRPGRALPGQSVWISDGGRCEARPGAIAYAGAFGTVRLAEQGAGRLAARAEVLRNAGGRYKVTLRCGDGTKFFDWLHVGPIGGAHAGEGGSVEGVNGAKVAAGAVLVTLAVGGGAVALRRRTKGRS